MASNLPTRFSSGLAVGALATAIVMGSYSLWINGSGRIQGNLDVSGTASGSKLTIEGTTNALSYMKTKLAVATGTNAKGAALRVAGSGSFTSTVTATTLSGSQLTINPVASASGKILFGTDPDTNPSGAYICMPNTSGVMKRLSIVNATFTVSAPTGTECSTQ